MRDNITYRLGVNTSDNIRLSHIERGESMTTKVIQRRRATIQPNGKVKRTGDVYFEGWYWNGARWNFKEFDTRAQASKFLEQYK